jgi:hypothetical protein
MARDVLFKGLLWMDPPKTKRMGKIRRLFQKAWNFLKKGLAVLASVVAGGLIIYLLN